VILFFFKRLALHCLFVFCIAVICGCSQEEPKRLKIGDPAPDFTIMDLQGHEASLSGWKGSPVILRFWDTECKYCRADTPIFNRYFDQYRERGLKVLYVATGNETLEGVKSFVADLDIIFPVALDHDMTMTTDYEIRMVPQTIFISPDQKILTAILGGVSEAELQELIGKYLDKMSN